MKETVFMFSTMFWGKNDSSKLIREPGKISDHTGGNKSWLPFKLRTCLEFVQSCLASVVVQISQSSVVWIMHY